MDLKEKLLKNNKTNLFGFRSHSQNINFYDLYLLYFNIIPNTVLENNINCKTANDFFIDKYKNEFKEKFYIKATYDDETKSSLKEVYYVLDGVMIVFFVILDKVYFLFTEKKSNKIQTIIDELIQFKKKEKKQLPEITLLINTSQGIETTSLKTTKPKLKIQDNYNDDFQVIHHTIYKRLSKNNDKGLILLYGKPGTGKTSYIRYLISTVKKKVIFFTSKYGKCNNKSGFTFHTC